MKYNVIRRFRDKYTGVIYSPGDTFTSDEADRIKDVLDRGLIAAVQHEQQDYNSLTKKELMVLLGAKGIEYNARQNKAELIALLGGE